MPGRQVQQQTFDAIVRESMEEFGLTSDEAIADAKDQLEKSGITDFSNISLTHFQHPDHDPDHQAQQLLDVLTASLQDSNPQVSLSDALTSFLDALRETPSLCGTAGALGAVNLSASALSHAYDQHPLSLIPACDLLVALCQNDDANRARFSQISETDPVITIKQILHALVQHNWPHARPDIPTFTPYVLKLISVLQHSTESVKRRLAAAQCVNTLTDLVTLLHHSVNSILSALPQTPAPADIRLYTSITRILRQLVSADDPTVDVSEAFLRARVLCGEPCVSDTGLTPLKGSPSLVDVIAEIAHPIYEAPNLPSQTRLTFLRDFLSTLRAITQADSICLLVFEASLHKLCLHTLSEFSEMDQIVITSLRLLRNIAGRDECKTPIFEHISHINIAAKKHVITSPKAAEAFCALVAQLTLRRPDIAREMVSNDVVLLIVDIMSKYAAELSVMNVASIAIRNICSRDDGVRRRVREDERVEDLLRRAWRHFGKRCDTAYYALREMDVLKDEELRRDERYTMPAGFYQSGVGKHC